MVTENLMEGGAQAFILRLAEALQNRNVSVRVLLLNDDLENLALTGLYPNVSIIRLHLPFRSLLRKLDSLLFHLRSDFSIVDWFHKRIITKRYADNTDVFHTHYPKADYLISRLKRHKALHIVSVHGDYKEQYEHHRKYNRSIWNHFENKLAYLKKSVHKWVLASEEQRRFFIDTQQLTDNKLCKIYYGFSKGTSQHANTVTRNSNDVFTVGMVARGLQGKGWRVLIEAFLLLDRPCRLRLAGDGKYLRELQKEFSNYNHISFLGYREDVLAVIKSCDVMVLPSHHSTESLPYSVIEALSCGKPVIASDVGELQNMLTEEESGALAGTILPLVNGQVQTEDLYKSLLEFYQNKEFLTEKSLLAAKAFSKFEMEKCVDAYISIYQGK
ncbi:MAG: glycosyltransferase family 4 protein [Flavisolibacter sp.]|nr:glycosyltransferase family 4 protein [Flavisolibacter sp.]